MAENKKASNELVRYSEHKHSVRFDVEQKGPGNVLDSVYFKRPLSDRAKRIRVTIEVLEEF